MKRAGLDPAFFYPRSLLSKKDFDSYIIHRRGAEDAEPSHIFCFTLRGRKAKTCSLVG